MPRNSCASLNLDSTQHWQRSTLVLPGLISSAALLTCFCYLPSHHCPRISCSPVRITQRHCQDSAGNSGWNIPFLVFVEFWIFTGLLHPSLKNKLFPLRGFFASRAVLFNPATLQENYSMLLLFIFHPGIFFFLPECPIQYCFNSQYSCSLDFFLYYIKLNFCIESTGKKNWEVKSPLLALLSNSVMYSSSYTYPYFILVNALQAFKGEAFLYLYVSHCPWNVALD